MFYVFMLAYVLDWCNAEYYEMRRNRLVSK